VRRTDVYAQRCAQKIEHVRVQLIHVRVKEPVRSNEFVLGGIDFERRGPEGSYLAQIFQLTDRYDWSEVDPESEPGVALSSGIAWFLTSRATTSG
jgi:hypothetical protein